MVHICLHIFTNHIKGPDDLQGITVPTNKIGKLYTLLKNIQKNSDYDKNALLLIKQHLPITVTKIN